MMTKHTYILVNCSDKTVVDIAHFEGDIMDRAFQPAKLAREYFGETAPNERIFVMLGSEPEFPK
jgi:hypothetical protein